jgi:hypothetical protein
MGKGMLDTLFSVRVAVTTTSSSKWAVESVDRCDCANTDEKKGIVVTNKYNIFLGILIWCKCALDNYNYYHINVKRAGIQLWLFVLKPCTGAYHKNCKKL